MRSIDRRLQSLARVYGCPRHGEALICAVCDASEPMPGWLKEGIDTFMDGLLSRVPPEAIRLAMSRVSPPTSEPCPRCEGLRTCLKCTSRYARELFKAIGLTPEEDAALQALTARVLAFEQG